MPNPLEKGVLGSVHFLNSQWLQSYGSWDEIKYIYPSMVALLELAFFINGVIISSVSHLPLHTNYAVTRFVISEVWSLKTYLFRIDCRSGGCVSNHVTNNVCSWVLFNCRRNTSFIQNSLNAIQVGDNRFHFISGICHVVRKPGKHRAGFVTLLP